MSFSVVQRTREIGIRVALGARPQQVIRPVVREGLLLAVAGLALGLAGSFAATRLLGRFLFGSCTGRICRPTRPSRSCCWAVALVATYIPSRRAARIDPITALRAD